MNKPVLIFTGGTLCSIMEGDSGLARPEPKRLKDLAEKVGFDVSLAVTPYHIDSIDFNIGLNYPNVKVKYPDYARLYDAVKKVLDAGDVPIVCGGTDTKAWYSALLTKDLMRHDVVHRGNNRKVIFLSSMRTFDKAPGLAENILKAGKLLSEQPLDGGFALSANNEQGTEFAVHDVLNQFDKIYPQAVDAFRSLRPVGRIADGVFTADKQYHAPTPLVSAWKNTYARIAPPLVRGQDSKVVLAYMKAMGDADPPFDGILIEGIPSRAEGSLQPGDGDRLVQATQWLHKKGIRVTFCNPVRFDGDVMAAVDSNPQWNRTELAEQLKKAGATFATGQPKDVYLDMLLATREQVQKKKNNAVLDFHDTATDISYAVPKQNVMEIRYVPDAATMRHGIGTLAPVADNIIFRALANAAVPDSLLQTVKDYSTARGFGRDFEYNGLRQPDGSLVKTDAHAYEAGKSATDYVPPAEVLRMRLAAGKKPASDRNRG